MANLVFDLGGVVLNWQPRLLLQQVLPQRARSDAEAAAVVKDLFQSFHPEGDWATFDRGTASEKAVAERIALRLGWREDEVMAVIEAIPAHLTPLPDTLSLMQTLRQAGHRLFFLSNMPPPYVTYLERRHDFFSGFEDGIFSCRVKLIKPEAAIFRLAQEQFVIEPPDIWFIDDVAHNISAAQALGWRGVQFHDAAQCASALEAAGLG